MRKTNSRKKNNIDEFQAERLPGIRVEKRADPVLSLYEKERLARAVFNEADEIKDAESHDLAERKFLQASEQFLSTPAISLDGLLLQAKYLKKHNDLEEVDVLVSGIENLLRNGGELPSKPSHANDPVVFHGNELAKLREALATIDEKNYEKDAEWQKSLDEKASKNILDRIEALEKLIASEKASSVEGALIQIAMVFHELSCLNTFQMDAYSTHKALRACFRMLYSIRDAIQAETKIRLEDLFSGCYMTDLISPWLTESQESNARGSVRSEAWNKFRRNA